MKKLVGCFFVFLLGVGATLGYLAWRDRAENRDAQQSIVLDLPSALAIRKDIAARIESARQRDGSSQLVISEAFHKAFIDVNEKGTEAAAATAVGMRAAGMPPQDEPAKFHADHPFLYLLRDTKSGAILFMGRVTDPS